MIDKNYLRKLKILLINIKLWSLSSFVVMEILLSDAYTQIELLIQYVYNCSSECCII